MFLLFTDSSPELSGLFYFCCFSIVKVLFFFVPRSTLCLAGNSHLLYASLFPCQVLFSKFVKIHDNEFFGAGDWVFGAGISEELGVRNVQ